MTNEPPAQFEVNDIIDYLVERKFRQNKDEDFPPISRWLTRQRTGPATLDAFFDDNEQQKATYKAELWNMSTETLTRLLAEGNATEDAERKARAKLQDETKFFSEPGAQADFAHWSKMVRWTLDEATALSLGKAPKMVSWESIKPYLQQSLFADEYSKRRELLLRASEHEALENPVLPAELIGWAQRIDITLPQELIDAVRATGSRIEDWQKLTAERDALREQMKQLEENAAKERPLSTRERETLLKIILGMAMEQYSYNPDRSRNEAPTQIADDLDSHGIQVTNDTVRTWLRTAADTVRP